MFTNRRFVLKILFAMTMSVLAGSVLAACGGEAATDVPIDSAVDDRPFLMTVEEVHTIKGRGTVATGQIEQGTISVNEEVEIIGPQGEILKTVVTGVEEFGKTLDEGQAGDNVGLLLRGIDRDDVKPGMVIAAPGSAAAP